MNCARRVACLFLAAPVAVLAAGGPPAPRELREELEAWVGRGPAHAGALYVAARTAARAGDEALAMLWLDRLEKAGSGDELDPDDFGSFAAGAAFRERADRFAQAAPPVGSAKATETGCRDLLPEGTAWDARRREVLVSSGRLRAVFAIGADGRCRPVVPQADGGLLAVLGMAVDAASDSLWVASTAAPFMADAKPGEAGTALLARIDLAAGRVVESVPHRGGMLNDLAIAGDGTIFVTESAGGAILRLPAGGRALEPHVPAGTFEGPNGIAVLEAGVLLVADFHGLSLVATDASGKVVRDRLASPPGLYLGGIDGIARRGRQLVAIQNLAGRGRVWSLEVDRAARRVGAKLLLRGQPDFRNPTTGAIAGGRFLFLADPNLQGAAPAGGVTPLPAGRRGHRLLALELPAD
ncbi:MAG: hypothetical protein IPL06_07320 [Betaproteobacteria bacterium]|nr:hypothetical protein [Betaproteobacteria bacterium]